MTTTDKTKESETAAGSKIPPAPNKADKDPTTDASKTDAPKDPDGETTEAGLIDDKSTSAEKGTPAFEGTSEAENTAAPEAQKSPTEPKPTLAKATKAQKKGEGADENGLKWDTQHTSAGIEITASRETEGVSSMSRSETLPAGASEAQIAAAKERLVKRFAG